MLKYLSVRLLAGQIVMWAYVKAQASCGLRQTPSIDIPISSLAMERPGQKKFLEMEMRTGFAFVESAEEAAVVELRLEACRRPKCFCNQSYHCLRKIRQKLLCSESTDLFLFR
jgi:hypothetical protein